MPRASHASSGADGGGARVEVGVVLDNGGGSVKAALVPLRGGRGGASAVKRLRAPNALARPGPSAAAAVPGSSRRPSGMLVGREIDDAPDFSAMSFRRAVDRGYVARWDVQRDVWASVFSADRGIGLRDPSVASLLVTEPPANPAHMRRAMDELVFESFGFAEYSAVSAARLVALGRAKDRARGHASKGPGVRHKVGSATALVLDSGFSFTHAVPVVNGVEIPAATRRLNLGGKALTNHLKETVSFRSWNMMEETAVVNAVKERLCFVSDDFMRDLRFAHKEGNTEIRREYILPDLSRSGVDPLGHVRTEDEDFDGSEQILVMNNERMSIPEVLFRPSDVGLSQAGVAELVVQAVEAAPVQYRADLYANIILAGGNCRFEGFEKRFLGELRPLVCENYAISCVADDDPVWSACEGGICCLPDESSPSIPRVTKQEYEEHGHGITQSRFRHETVSGDGV